MDISVFQIIAIVFFVLAFVFLALTIAIFFTQDIVSVIGYFTGITAKKQTEQIRNQTTNISYGKKKKSNHNKAYDGLIDGSTPSSISAPSVSPQTAGAIKADAHPSRQLGKKRKGFVDAPVISAQQAVADNGTVSLDTITSNIETINPTDVLNNVKVAAPAPKSEDDIPTSVLSNDSEMATSVLSNTEPTNMLDDSEAPTGVLSDTEPTDMLDDSEAPTGVLSDDTEEMGTTVLNAGSSETTVLSSGNNSSSTPFEIVEDTTFFDTDEVIE